MQSSRVQIYLNARPLQICFQVPTLSSSLTFSGCKCHDRLHERCGSALQKPRPPLAAVHTVESHGRVAHVSRMAQSELEEGYVTFISSTAQDTRGLRYETIDGSRVYMSSATWHASILGFRFTIWKRICQISTFLAGLRQTWSIGIRTRADSSLRA